MGAATMSADAIVEHFSEQLEGWTQRTKGNVDGDAGKLHAAWERGGEVFILTTVQGEGDDDVLFVALIGTEG
jgi:hypothetical protein